MFFILLDWILITHLAKHGRLDPLVTGFELFCTHGTWKNFRESRWIGISVILCQSAPYIIFYFDQGLVPMFSWVIRILYGLRKLWCSQTHDSKDLGSLETLIAYWIVWDVQNNLKLRLEFSGLACKVCSLYKKFFLNSEIWLYDNTNFVMHTCLGANK